MTGLNLFDEGMKLLGYVNDSGVSGREEMLKKALPLINRVYSDLYYSFEAVPGEADGFKPLTAISQEIQLSSAVLNDVAPYGMAMYLAQSESDADNQALYASLYNQKKTRGKRITTIKNSLPHIWG